MFGVCFVCRLRFLKYCKGLKGFKKYFEGLRGAVFAANTQSYIQNKASKTKSFHGT